MEMDGRSWIGQTIPGGKGEALERVKTGNVRLTLRRMFETAIGNST